MQRALAGKADQSWLLSFSFSFFLAVQKHRTQADDMLSDCEYKLNPSFGFVSQVQLATAK